MSPVKNETLFAAWATVCESPRAYQASGHNHPPTRITPGGTKGLPRLVAAPGGGLLLCISIPRGSSLLTHVHLLCQHTAFIFLFSRDVAGPRFCSPPSSGTGRACGEHRAAERPRLLWAVSPSAGRPRITLLLLRGPFNSRWCFSLSSQFLEVQTLGQVQHFLPFQAQTQWFVLKLKNQSAGRTSSTSAVSYATPRAPTAPPINRDTATCGATLESMFISLG